MKTVLILKRKIPDDLFSQITSPAPGDNMIICDQGMSHEDKSKYPGALSFNHLGKELVAPETVKEFLNGENDYRIIFCFSLKETALQWILPLYKAGLRNFLWMNYGKLIKHPLPLVFALKLFKFVNFKLIMFLANHARFLHKILAMTYFLYRIPSELRTFMSIQGRGLPDTTPDKIKILNFIGSLGPGGAERQFCNLVTGLKAEGYKNIKVLTYLNFEGANGHYLQRLKDADIQTRCVDFTAPYQKGGLIDLLPFIMKREVRAIYNEIIKDPPDIFHAWLDTTNIMGALAALIAGVPRVILSTRSVSPYHFPHIYKPWFRPFYRLLAKSPKVYFINNSTNGGKDYAEWLGIPFERFKIILNGIDFEEMKKPLPQQTSEFRKSMGIKDDAIVLCGVFRLTSEKRPELFFKIADVILRKYKNVYVFHVGDGPQKKFLEQKIAANGHKDRFILLGHRKDIPLILSSSNILLLTSKNEGTPNVILEAEWFGCCPVATAAGGIPDCIEHGKTGFIHGIYDEEGLVASISELVKNEAIRKSVALAAPEFIKKRFNMTRMLDETLTLYNQDPLGKQTGHHFREMLMFQRALRYSHISKFVIVIRNIKQYNSIKEDLNGISVFIVYPEDLEESAIDCEWKHTYNPLKSGCFPIKEISNFLKGEEIPTLIFMMPFENVSLKWILLLKFSGIKEIFTAQDSVFTSLRILPALYLKFYSALHSRLYTILWGNISDPTKQKIGKINISKIIRIIEEHSLARRLLGSLFFLKVDSGLCNITKFPLRRFSSENLKEMHITNMIGSLGSGGSERQLCNLVRGLKANGFKNLDIIIYNPLEGADSHYLPLLQEEGIDASSVDFMDSSIADIDGIKMIPPDIRPVVAAVYRKLEKNPPDILHIWLDYTNVTGALAAILLRVPRIILSTRNVSPVHIARFYLPWLRPFYKLFTQCNNIAFISNSYGGAFDYSEWISCPDSIFEVILNGVDFSEIKVPSEADVAAFRNELGIEKTIPLICGVFRLSAEKRPERFVEIAAEVIKKHPDVHFVHAGEDHSKGKIMDYAQKLGIAERIHFLGRRKDVPVIMSASKAILLTSEFEGTPNVLLEAQWLHCPPVATGKGGVEDCIQNGKTGFYHKVYRKSEMVNEIINIIMDDELHANLSKEAHSYIKGNFTLDKMVSKTIDLYSKHIEAGKI